ncbi:MULTISPECIES: hypothetical protein [unclassified Archaeoglobus]|nr:MULTISPECIES: hypothetical protein [unclassified Archaeoglobus]
MKKVVSISAMRQILDNSQECRERYVSDGGVVVSLPGFVES